VLAGGAASDPAYDTVLSNVKPIEHHELVPDLYEVLHEADVTIAAGIHFGNGHNETQEIRKTSMSRLSAAKSIS
jgi:hypothetical protein